MVYFVYVQGVVVARFTERYMADWFVNLLKSGKDALLNINITQLINCNNFQDCEIMISEYDTKDM